ncbi:MAG: metallophosphoesterase, partial [Rhizobiales bacterium]|nr:metallophosphoesterase [Hyphomicrobiales bacterium]
MIGILSKINKPVLLVSGNHDNLMQIRKLCLQHEHLHLLHGDGIAIDGIDFFGLGCEVPKSNDNDWNEWLSEDAAAKMLKNMPNDCVLISHSPAYGKCDLQIYGAHEGSNAILDCVELKQ